MSTSFAVSSFQHNELLHCTQCYYIYMTSENAELIFREISPHNDGISMHMGMCRASELILHNLLLGSFRLLLSLCR
jgi:hypothetical protein